MDCPAEVRGPWFCRCSGQSVQDVFTPVPATLQRVKGQSAESGELIRLDPLPSNVALPGWQPPEPGNARYGSVAGWRPNVRQVI